MKNEIIDYIVVLLEKKKPLPKGAAINELRYLETGYVDSLGLMKFVMQLEDKFNIEISEKEIMSESFSHISGLAEIINKKMLM